MSELYTSLKHAKMAMNGGHLPPMTPLGETAKRFIAPEQVLGMGGLIEDKQKGLRCPVRGCTSYRHRLATHLNQWHGGLGGAAAVRAALDIPPGVSLCSTAMRQKNKAAARAAYEQRLRSGLPKPQPPRPANAGRPFTMHTRNFRNTCEAQIFNRLLDLAHRNHGTTPTLRQATLAYSRGFVSSIMKLYGSWNGALAHFNFATRKPYGQRTPEADIYAAFEPYARRHGRLPTHHEATDPARTPLVPVPETVCNALGVKSWPLAMSRVAFVLGIDDPRYSPAALARTEVTA